MSPTELKKYDRKSLLNEESLKKVGSGSSGTAKLFYDKKMKDYVVGKFFSSSGQQSKIDEQFVAAEREAAILAQFQHKNIVRILGVVYWDEVTFVIIMEYAPCKDLETLLHSGKDIDLPWKLRARFFTELAKALDYIHNHNPKRSFIHGDLKPQNVLLGDMLKIKLADFGSAAIAQLTGATSLTIGGDENTQHTPYYAAPEFLKHPTKKKTKSMDVYGFGMIGYEILTRTVVYSGVAISSDLLLRLIKETGQKPDVECLSKVGKSLEQNRYDKETFNKLEDEVKKCWQTDAKDRPLISDVKKRLEKLALAKQIYDKTTDDTVKTVVGQRNLKEKLLSQECTRKMATIKKVVKWLVLISLAVISFPAFSVDKLSFSNDTMGYFLILDDSKLALYEMESGNVTSLAKHPDGKTKFNQIVKANDLIYMFPHDANKTSVTLNLSDPTLTYKKIEWEERYLNRKYIALGRYLFAVGGRQKTLTYAKQVRSLDNFFITSAVDMYDTVTEEWTAMKDMNEARYLHSLFLFQGSICALEANAIECYNPNNKAWTYLPEINLAQFRLHKAAVELNGELYVIGGTSMQYDVMRVLPLVEKYNPVNKSWTNVASLTQPRRLATAGVFQGKIYVIGEGSDRTEKYDPASDKWTTLSHSLLPNFTVIEAKTAI